MHTHGRRELIGAAFCWLASLCLYLLTQAPTVQGFDSAELTVGAYSLGFVHPPGYPLYMLLGNLFSRLPIANVGYRLNLMSAVFASLSVGILFRLLARQVRSPWAALPPTLLFAATPLFWSQATRAEVYTLHIFLMTATLFAWYEAIEDRHASGFWICYLLLGLGMGNHITSLLLWAATLLSLAWLEPRQRRMALLANIPGILLAGLCYLYFPWRAGAAHAVDYIRTYFEVNLASLSGMAWLVSGRAFHCLLLPQGSLAGELLRLLDFLWTGMLGFGLALALWGWLSRSKSAKTGVIQGCIAQRQASHAEIPTPTNLGQAPNRQDTRELMKKCFACFATLREAFFRGIIHLNPWNVTLTAYFAANLLMFVAYRAIDKEVMFLPAYIVLCVWMAYGLQGFAGWLASFIDPQAGQSQEQKMLRGVQITLSLLALALILAAAAADWPAVSLRGDRRVYDFSRRLLEGVPPNTTIVNHWITASVIDYLQIVDGLRPDVQNINIDFYFLGIQQDCAPITAGHLVHSGWFANLQRLSNAGLLCFIEPLHGLPDGSGWKSNGLCWHIRPQKNVR